MATNISILLILVISCPLNASGGDKNLNILKQEFFKRLEEKFDNDMDNMPEADRKVIVDGIKKMLNEKHGRKRRRKQYQHLNWKPNIGQWDFSRLRNIFGR